MASEQIHCSQNFFPFVFMLMFSPLLCLCPYSLYLTLCILLYPCKYSASSFPLVPSCIFLLPAPPSPRPLPYMYLLPDPLFSLPLHVHVCLATSSLLLLQKNARVFPPLIAIYVFVCSLYTLNILCVLFCSVLLSSHGPDGPELFMIDPSGVSWVKNIYIYI